MLTEFQKLASAIINLQWKLTTSKHCLNSCELSVIADMLRELDASVPSPPAPDITGLFQWDRAASEIGVIGREPYPEGPKAP